MPSANDSGPRWEDFLAVLIAVPLFIGAKMLLIFAIFTLIEVLT